MKQWFVNSWLYLLGASIGSVAGFLYYKFIGCVSGTCPITSNPVRSTIYFAIIGVSLFGMFKKGKKDLQKNDSLKEPDNN